MSLDVISWLLIIVILVLGWLSFKQSGYAYALVTSTYAVEHIILQGKSGLPIRGSFLNIFMGLTCLAALLFAHSRGELRGFGWSKTAQVGFGLLLLAFISITWSPDFDLSLKIWRENIPYLILFAVLAPICLYPPGQVNRFLTAMAVIGSVTCLGLVFSEMTGRSVQVVLERGKLQNLNPLAAASFGAYTSLCALFLLYKQNYSLGWKPVLYGIVVLGVFVIAQSGSRGQFFGFMMAAALWLPLTAGLILRRSTIIAIAFVGAASLVAYFFFDNLGFAGRLQADSVQTSMGFRFDLALRLLNTTYSSGGLAILLGLGSSAAFPIVGYYPHIVPLEILAEEGVFGFLLFVIFITWTYRDAFVELRRKSLSRNDRVDLCLLGTLVTFELILCLKQGSLIGQAAFFSFALGLSCVITNLRKRDLPVPRMNGR